MKKVKIIIPLYREIVPELELKSLLNTLNVLNKYEIAFIIPESLTIETLKQQFGIDRYQIIRLSEEWIGSKNGIAGYNNMMMSKEFYELFSDVEYVLICHTDAYIFRDELDYWCSHDYDYIAAPFPKRNIYNMPFIKQYLQLKSTLFRKKKMVYRQDLFNRVCNGGLSLRKVSSFILACDKYKEEINYFGSQKHHMYNEDVFWSIIPKEFKYPDINEALKFSFDVKPELCYRLNNNQLPFGCHGITKPKIYDFWHNIINQL